MNRTIKRNVINMSPLRALLVAATAAVLAGNAAYAADAPAKKPAAAKSAATKAPAQKAYATPEALFQALADAAQADDLKTLHALFGPKGDAVTSSGDAVADKQRRANFAASYAEKHSVTMDGDTKATLIVGKEDWPMPVPAVKGARGWTLDTAAGSKEMFARRVGQNELSAIQVVRAIGDAQRDYASEDRDVNGLPNYARKFVSSPGKKDGLYWPTKEGEPQSPLGPLAAQASSEGYSKKSAPYHGYYYRILTAQGKDAKGGVQNYIVQGMMIGGFAVVAYPATYANSGVMTFMAGADGVVYEKDLGANTAAIARAMQTYNPDSSWKPVP